MTRAQVEATYTELTRTVKELRGELRACLRKVTELGASPAQVKAAEANEERLRKRLAKVEAELRSLSLPARSTAITSGNFPIRGRMLPLTAAELAGLDVPACLQR